MTRLERIAAIEELENLRGSRVLSYFTSTRPNAETQMANDVIPYFYEHVRSFTADPPPKVDLVLHSNGGDGVVPWRLVNLIREHSSHFAVLVPSHAFSAATLTALGADEIVMHPMGVLGPIDPTVGNQYNPDDPNNPGQKLGISVEDVASYIALVKEDVGIGHEDELVQALLALTDKIHPLALGNVKRQTAQARMMGEKLMRSRTQKDLDDHDIKEVIEKLTSQLYYHGHPISRTEARDDLGLSFVHDSENAVEEAMWDLYSLYATEMKFREPFNPIHDALDQVNGLPPHPQQVQQQTVTLSVVQGFVESSGRCDKFESEFEVTLTRNPVGELNTVVNRLRAGWNEEAPATPPSATGTPAGGASSQGASPTTT